MLRNMTSPCFNDYPPTNIIAAKGRLSTNFAIVVSFDVKEGAVSATLPGPETGFARTDGLRAALAPRASLADPGPLSGSAE
jgi:hypothetical protein